jgi:peptidoglycan/LPS O-acetylase OafA/YrhL
MSSATVIRTALPRAVDEPRHGAPVPAPPPTGLFRRDVQGLRAVAILLVVAQHAGVGLVSGGYVGVDVFFVISGFLITGQLFGELERTGRISLARFYARRMTRLLPAATVVVLGTLAAAWHWMPPLSIKSVSWDTLASAGYAMNYRLALLETDYLNAQRDPSPLQHFWSLAVEEQFYLFWPLLLVLGSMVWVTRGRPSARSASVVLAMLCAASLTLCVTETLTDQPWAYFSLHTRAWEFGAGALIALGARKAARLSPGVAAALTWAGLAAIGYAAVVYTDATVFPGHAALVPVAGAALVIAGGCARPGRGAELLLRRKPFQELGRVSYSWYLWHWPILILAPYALGYEPSWTFKVVLVLAALVPASMSLAAVEDPIRQHRIFRGGSGRGLGLGIGLSTCVIGAALVLLQLPAPVVQGTRTATDTAGLLQSRSLTPAELQTLIRTSSTARTLPANLRPGLEDAPDDLPRDQKCGAPLQERSISYNIGNGCEHRGFTAGRTTVVLFGDSHADQWFDALNVVAQQRRWRLVVFTKGNCTAAFAAVPATRAAARRTPCEQWRSEALERIRQLRPQMVVMSSLDRQVNPDGGDSDTVWAQAWRRTVTTVKGFGAATVIIQDTPYPVRNVPACLSARPMAVQQCGLRRSTAIDATRQAAVRRIGVQTGTKVIEVTPWLCTATTCPAILGDTLVYRDGSHLTATYSKLLGGVLGREFDE